MHDFESANQLAQNGYLVVGAAIVLFGFLLTIVFMHSVKLRLGIGAALGFVPPLVVGLLYWHSASQGCAGGSCTGSMILIGLLGVIALIPTLLGLGIFLAGIIGLMRAGIARLRAA